mgnify:CR=1 FL=1
MSYTYLKYYKPKVFIALVIYFVSAIIWANANLSLSLSVTAIIGFIMILIEKYLWKIKPFSWMFWVDDFSGRYEGQLEYKYLDQNCNLVTDILKHVKIISQTGGSICIYSFTINKDGTQSSVSENKGMHVEKTRDGKHYELMYNYLNDGNPQFSTHYGTEIIKFIKTGNAKKLSGRYYTERLPYQTRGKFLNLQWVSNNLEHDF